MSKETTSTTDSTDSTESTESTEKLLAGGVTQSQIDQWKKDNPEGVHQIDVPMDNKESSFKTCYLKTPGRKVIGAAMRHSGDPVKMNEILLTNTWLGGDEIIKIKDEYFMSAATKLSEVFNIREANIKKL